MKRTSKLILLLAAIPLLGGCATIFTGTSDSITIITNPPGAQIYVNGLERGQTPNTVRVKRNLSSADITLRLEGHETRTFTLEQEFNAVSVLNLFNILFWGIDAATGSLMRYRPQMYEINLIPRSALSPDEAGLPVDISELEKRDGKYLLDKPGNIVVTNAIKNYVMTITVVE